MRKPRQPRAPRGSRAAKKLEALRGTICPRAARIFAEGLGEFTELYADEPSMREGSAPGLLPQDPEMMECAWENAAINLCESPIEQQLLAALAFTTLGYGPYATPIWDHTMPDDAVPQKVTFVAPQYTFGDYRIDIAVFFLTARDQECRLAIECDGHAYHKTKEQAERDRKRDRYLQLHGWRTIRFTGSEIYRDAKACASEVADFVTDLSDLECERRGILQTDWRKRKLAKLGFRSPFDILDSQLQAA